MRNIRPSCHPTDVRRRVVVTGAAVSRIDFELQWSTPTERLLAQLLARALRVFPESHFQRPLLRAARETVRLAEQTGYALLLLPELFAELAIAEMLKAEYLRMGRI
jgi:hypothetical protein